MSQLAGISVVIPNYNGIVLLPQILPNVFAALKNTGLPAEVIVVDDCSPDGTVKMLEEKFSSVKIIQNEINSGFSITSNRGIRSAQYDWVLLLNSDVKLEPDYFKPLLKYTEQPNVFGVMGRIIGWDDDEIQDGAKYPYFHGVKIKTSGNYLLQDEKAMKDGLYSMYISGANAFMNKKIFLEIGGLNELFSPFYVEDFELSLRAWRLGYTCWYDYNAVCRHRTSTTIVNGNKRNYVRKIYNRNKMYLHAIHLETGKRPIWFLQLFAECIGQLVGFKVSYVRAVWLFLKNYKKVKYYRKEMHQNAKDNHLLTIGEVVDKINVTLKGKALIRF
jgi:GT2 family glycosyltransferase